MEAASEGASRAGGHTIGVVVPQLFAGRGTANQFVAETIEASSLTERIGLMTDRACGSIVLPGSIGTATELFTAWNLNHIARRNGGERFPTVAIGETWPLLAQILAATGASLRDVELTENVEQAVDWLFTQPEVLAQVSRTL